jgi:predicted CoA-binding protein
MNSKHVIDEFLNQRTLAIVGVSRSGKKFGNAVLRDLTGKGYRLFPVNPNAQVIDGNHCYPNLQSLPEPVGGVVAVVPPRETERVVREAHEAGINRVWMQQGAESESAIEYCKDHSMGEVHGECILMFAQPTAVPHRIHRFFRGLFGKLPR